MCCTVKRVMGKTAGNSWIPIRFQDRATTSLEELIFSKDGSNSSYSSIGKRKRLAKVLLINDREQVIVEDTI